MGSVRPVFSWRGHAPPQSIPIPALLKHCASQAKYGCSTRWSSVLWPSLWSPIQLQLFLREPALSTANCGNEPGDHAWERRKLVGPGQTPDPGGQLEPLSPELELGTG